MFGDAAQVKLDITKELLLHRRWDEARIVAAEAADTFARNDSRLHLAAALAYLREAVAKRAATPELAIYVRAYFETDDPVAVFRPPN
jgi:hypothetical protein